MNIKIFLITFLSFLVISCFPAKQYRSNADYKRIAFEKFGPETSFLFSTENSYVLCLKYNSESLINPQSLAEFFIFSNINNAIVYQDKIAGASFTWKSDTELRIFEQNGIIKTPLDSGKTKYMLDLNTLKKSLILDSAIDSLR